MSQRHATQRRPRPGQISSNTFALRPSPVVSNSVPSCAFDSEGHELDGHSCSRRPPLDSASRSQTPACTGARPDRGGGRRVRRNQRQSDCQQASHAGLPDRRREPGQPAGHRQRHRPHHHAGELAVELQELRETVRARRQHRPDRHRRAGPGTRRHHGLAGGRRSSAGHARRAAGEPRQGHGRRHARGRRRGPGAGERRADHPRQRHPQPGGRADQRQLHRSPRPRPTSTPPR